MDAAYFVRAGENEELRYSLRSLTNVIPAPDNVWIVGDPPDWYTGPHIPGNRYDTKQRNVYDNVRIIAEHPDLPETVAVWNDDMYAVAPAVVEIAYRCTLAEHLRRAGLGSWWGQSLKMTRTYLGMLGYPDPLSYELHRPLPIHRASMAQILADAADMSIGNPPQWRTLYGNLTGAGGEQALDGKVYGESRPMPTGPWLSSSDHNFERVRPILADLYPDPSPWES